MSVKEILAFNSQRLKKRSNILFGKNSLRFLYLVINS